MKDIPAATYQLFSMKASIKEIAFLLGAGMPQHDYMIDTLLTDSRSLTNPEGTLFFAIKTAGNDGHNYIHELFTKGVRNFIVTRIPDDMENSEGTNFIIVNDTLKALAATGTFARNQFKGSLLSITGSKGKTTLKEWLFQLLGPLEEVSRSPRSYNSQIGVPLSLWNITPGTDTAIIEAGISTTGEMDTLRRCIKPDTVIITNILDDHSEGFTSDKEKAEEKARLASGPETKTIIYNADNPLLREAILPLSEGKRLIGWSTADSSAPLFINRSYPSHDNGDTLREIEYTFQNKTSVIKAPLATPEDLENGANALAYLLAHGVARDTISRQFKTLTKIGTRLNVSEGVNGCSVVYDSYTSDFSSLRPALDMMLRRAMPGQTPTLILSDLKHEVGDPKETYSQIAALVKESGVRRFIGIGETLRKYASLFTESSIFFRNTEDFLNHLSTSDFANEIILLKGAPEFDFGRILELLEARKHETVLEVNLDALLKNYKYFKSHIPPSTGIIAMVKASGYGAGSREIAKTLQDCGAAYLAVAVLDEGIDLRGNGITMPIMVMNPKVVNYKSMFSNRLEPEIYSMEMLLDVINEARKNGIKDYPIHIKLDTGMHRMGFIEQELPALMDILDRQDAVMAKSVFSHLATADCPDMDDYTNLQLERFQRYTDYMESRSPYHIMRHVLNSAGILRFANYHYDMVRLGIGLYGANTLPPDMEQPLAPVSTLRTVIIAIREWDAGETVGYGRRGRLHRRSRIATIPIGYADGMNRHFGCGTISVKVKGKDCPTVGNICMDACMIDVTDVECTVGDDVEIFGKDAPVQRLADVLGTIPYEILTSVSPRVKRIYYRE